MRRVLVCGGRYYNDRGRVFDVLDALHKQQRIEIVIQGGATGADELARTWADLNNVEVATHLPDWNAHGRAAGPIRNQEMIDVSEPNLAVAFPGGRGTADMVARL